MRFPKQTKKMIRKPVPVAAPVKMTWQERMASGRALALREGNRFKLWLLQNWQLTLAYIGKLPIPIIVFLIWLFSYSYRPLVQGLDDNVPLRFGSVLLATEGAVDWEVLNPDITTCNSFSRTENDYLVSHTPIGTAALGAIVFKIALYLGFDMSPDNIVFFDCFAANLLSALTVAMLAWIVRRHGRRTAFWMALLFAFGTAVWSVSSRQLWQHTGELFWLMMGLCVLDGASRHGLRLVIATFLFALAIWCRPQAATIVIVVMGYQWRRNWRLGIVALIILILLMALWMVNNYYESGTLLGTYLSKALGYDSLIRFAQIINPFSPRDFGLLGAYFSFNVGLCIFSPLVLLGICLLPGAWRRRHQDPELSVMALATTIGVVFRGLVPNWAGWNVFGGRYMLDFIPCMMLVIAPFMRNVIEGDNPEWSRKKLRVMRCVLLLAAISSTFIQWMGVSRESHLWNSAMWKRYEFWYSRKAWEWRRPLMMHMLTHGRHTAGWPESPDTYVLPKNGVIDLSPKPNPYIWYGFTMDSTIGWWTVPPESGLAITLNKDAWYKLRLTVAGPTYILDPLRVEFFWNGIKIGEHIFEGAFLHPQKTEWMDLPRQYLNVGKVSDFSIRTNRAYYGRLASQGATGVALQEIEIKEF